MRLLSTLHKSLLENFRDLKILIFVLAFAPAFMFILHGMYSDTEPAYSIAIISEDKGQAATELVDYYQAEHYDSLKPKYNVTTAYTLEEAKEAIKKRQIEAILAMGPDFSEDLARLQQEPNSSPVPIMLYGDTQNQTYTIAAIYLLSDFEIYLEQKINIQLPYDLKEEFVGLGSELTEFDLFVPGLLIFALLNVMFTAGASFLKEAEKLTLHRMMLSKLKSYEFVLAILIVQAILCQIAMSLALGAAIINGFVFNGSYSLLSLICLISTLGVVGVALITVSFLKSVYDLMTIGVIPYFVVMFFSGLFFPLSSPVITQLGSLTLKLNDLLPLTLSVTAVNQVLNFGIGIKDLMPELLGTTVISTIYFVIGLYLFNKNHMQLKTNSRS